MMERPAVGIQTAPSVELLSNNKRLTQPENPTFLRFNFDFNVRRP
jgi:hypothetical protein